MLNLRPFLLFTVAAALLPLAGRGVRAQGPAGVAGEKFPAGPPELFAAVAKDVRPQWRACFSQRPHDAAGDRNRAALALGAAVADCYLAAEARDAQQLRNDLMDMAAIEKTLSIGRPMESGRQRLADLAEAGDWVALRGGIAAVQALHAQTLKVQMDEPLVELESLGLWLRALQISAVHTSKMAKPPERPCVWSAEFLGSLQTRAEAAAERDGKSAALKSLAEGMGRLKVLWQGETTPANAAERLAATLPLLDTLTAGLIYAAPASPP